MTSPPIDVANEDGGSALRLDFERTDEAPSLARAAVRGFCEDQQVSAATAATVMLLVSELVTNAVIHPEADLAGMIGLSAWITDATIRIEVSDEGSGFTPQPRDPRRLKGYGLYLVKSQSNQWGIERTPQTTVWFELEADRLSPRSTSPEMRG